MVRERQRREAPTHNTAMPQPGLIGTITMTVMIAVITVGVAIRVDAMAAIAVVSSADSSIDAGRIRCMIVTPLTIRPRFCR